MRTRWAGVLLVVIVAVGVIAYKQHRLHTGSGQVGQGLSSEKPEILLVVDPREADTKDNCAEIIRLVRGASGRGVKVQELPPESDSPLLRKYRVLTVPTVLILDRDGNVVSRYAGEESSTVQQIRDRLASLNEVQH